MKITRTIAALALFAVFNANAAKGPQPTICQRGCWGARNGSCSSHISSLTRAIIHHTASSSGFQTSSLTESKGIVKGIQNGHMDVNGMCDIAYHFVVDKLGNIFEGREGSMNSLIQGAHAGCGNVNTFGFTFIGYFHPPYNQDPPPAMRNAVYDVIAWRMPGDWSPYGGRTSYPGSLNGTAAPLDTHRWVGANPGSGCASTACPGDVIINKYITGSFNGGEMRNEIEERKNGLAGDNPPYDFNDGKQGWITGGGISDVTYTSNETFPGVINFDQVDDNGFVTGPLCAFEGQANQAVYVRYYPEGGTASLHSMQAQWKTLADNSWDATKASESVHFNGQDQWFALNLDVTGNAWASKNIRKMRLNFDNVNKSVRWRIDKVLVQDIPRYLFNSDTLGWDAGANLNGYTWVSSAENENGVLRFDQTGSWAYITSPAISGFKGALNDRIAVHLYAKWGNSALHDAEIKWRTVQDDVYTEDKTSPLVSFTAQNQWVTLTFDVGSNNKWTAKDITRVRLRLDSVNKNTRWVINNIRIIHDLQAN